MKFIELNVFDKPFVALKMGEEVDFVKVTQKILILYQEHTGHPSRFPEFAMLLLLMRQ